MSLASPVPGTAHSHPEQQAPSQLCFPGPVAGQQPGKLLLTSSLQLPNVACLAQTITPRSHSSWASGPLQHHLPLQRTRAQGFWPKLGPAQSGSRMPPPPASVQRKWRTCLHSLHDLLTSVHTHLPSRCSKDSRPWLIQPSVAGTRTMFTHHFCTKAVYVQVLVCVSIKIMCLPRLWWGADQRST